MARRRNVIAACSGGADSLTLTDIMAKAAEEDDVTVLVAHVHHHLRGEEAMKMPVLFQLSARIGTYPIPNLISIPRPSRKKRASPWKMQPGVCAMRHLKPTVKK